jgi:hypothetical protein
LAAESRAAPLRHRWLKTRAKAKNALSRAVCFHRRDMVQDRTFDDQRLRAGGLNLVVAAIVLWNTVYRLPRTGRGNAAGRRDGRARRIAPASVAIGLGTHYLDWRVPVGVRRDAPPVLAASYDQHADVPIPGRPPAYRTKCPKGCRDPLM